MNLDQGIKLIQIAGEIAPPLAKLIGEALDSHAKAAAPINAEDSNLVARVRAALPERSKTREAIDALGGDEKGGAE
jgi:hypothetical protein